MGTFQIKVRVSRNKGAGPGGFDGMFWVDSGALYTYVPEDVLGSIGVEPNSRREFVLADGRKDVRPIGEAVLKLEGLDEERTCVVVFAPKGSLFLLGATALENFGVAADPVNRKLNPIVALLGGHLTGRSDPD